MRRERVEPLDLEEPEEKQRPVGRSHVVLVRRADGTEYAHAVGDLAQCERTRARMASMFGVEARVVSSRELEGRS